MNTVNVGYVRVSKSDGTQKLDLQKDALKLAGVEESRIYEDHATGKNDKRPGLQACLKALQPGNTLVVWKLDRIGRNLSDLNKIINFLNNNRINLKIITTNQGPIDTSSPIGKLMFNLFAMFAEYERDVIRERTMAGLQAARARGRLGGRPQKVTEPILRVLAMEMRDPETRVSELAKKYNLTRAIIYRYINPDGTLKPAGERILQVKYKKQQQDVKAIAMLRNNLSIKDFSNNYYVDKTV